MLSLSVLFDFLQQRYDLGFPKSMDRPDGLDQRLTIPGDTGCIHTTVVDDTPGTDFWDAREIPAVLLREVPHIGQDAEQVFLAARLEDGKEERPNQFETPRDIGLLLSRLELIEELLEPRQVQAIEILREPLAGEYFEFFTNTIYLLMVRDRQLADERPAAGMKLDQAFRLQLPQGFAYGHRAYPERFRQIVLP